MPKLLKNFTLPKVIASTSPATLQHYLYNRKLLQHIPDFEQYKKEQKAEKYKVFITESILNLEAKTGEVIHDFQRCYVLAKKEAMQHLFHRVQLLKQYQYLIEAIEKEEIEREYDKLFYILEKEPDLINDFYLIYTLNTHSESYWNRRHTDIIARDEDISSKEINALREAIKEALLKQTHGKHCYIQNVLFDGKDHLFAMAEDMPTTISLWQGGKPEEMLIHPSFDVAFVYNRHEGELDICCTTGGARFRNQMQQAFSKAVLGREINALPKDDESYDLPLILEQLVYNKRVDFAVNHASHVEDIFIRSVRLASNSMHNGQITLDTKLNHRISDKQDDIYTKLETYLKLDDTSPNTVGISEVSVTWLECIAIYYDPIQQKKAKKRFNLSGRSGCNLGFEGVDKEIRQCLKIAGIQKAGVDNDKQQAA